MVTLLAVLTALVCHEAGHAIAAISFGRKVRFVVDRRGIGTAHDGRDITIVQQLLITGAGAAANFVTGAALAAAATPLWAWCQMLLGLVALLYPHPHGDGAKIVRGLRRSKGS